VAANLVVLTFESETEAQQVLDALKQGQHDGIVHIDDAAVVSKDADGKVHVKNQVAKGTWMSTGVGGVLGLLIGTIFFPIGGLVLGLAGGALVGRMLDLGVDGKFVKEVGEEIKPNTSALFILTKQENVGGELAILRQFKGKVLQTNLSSEAEESLRKALSDDSPAS
jgi:uncharacterized membrane protein